MTVATLANKDDLYTCYCRFMEDSSGSLMEISLTDEQRDFVRERLNQPMPREQFEQVVSELEPEQRAQLETTLRTPWEQLVKEGIREAEQALHDYETDPAVRARVAKEVETALGNRRKPMD